VGACAYIVVVFVFVSSFDYDAMRLHLYSCVLDLFACGVTYYVAC
jgi:hypothetical protein